MNSGGHLSHPLVRLGIAISLILLLTQIGWLEALIIFLLTGMLGTFSVPPLLMLFAYIIASAYITRYFITRFQRPVSQD